VRAISDLMAKRVLFVTPGKVASVWGAFAAELLWRNGYPNAIRRVAIDMIVADTKGLSDNLETTRLV
jgi:transposase